MSATDAATRRQAWFAPLVAALLVVVFFSNLHIYLGLMVLPAIQPLHWIIGFSGLAGLMLLSPALRARGVPGPLFAWVAAYSALCLAWYAAFGGGDPQILRQRLLAHTFLCVSAFVFTRDARCITAARRAMVAVVLVVVLLNAWDISHPFYFVPAFSEFSTLGRASGIYMNPNSAGAALVLGFIITIGVVPERWKTLYIVAVSAAVVLTLSRAAMASLAVVLFLLFWAGEVRVRNLFWAALVGALLGWFAWAVVIPLVASDFKLNPALIVDRLLWLLDPDSGADFSQAERIQLAAKGWEQFRSSPWIGNGVGSTELWAARASTHNTYLMMMSDFGAFGALVLPALASACIAGTDGAGHRSRWAMLAFLLLWGMASHNLLTDNFILVAVALFASMQYAGASPRGPAPTIGGAADLRPPGRA